MISLFTKVSGEPGPGQAEGKFDVVLIYYTSRFARTQVEARRYKQLLRERLGIRVV